MREELAVAQGEARDYHQDQSYDFQSSHDLNFKALSRPHAISVFLVLRQVIRLYENDLSLGLESKNASHLLDRARGIDGDRFRCE